MQWPYPHLYQTNVFPPDFYAQLIANLPSTDEYKDIGFKNRLITEKGRTPPIMQDFAGPYFAKHMLTIFHKAYWERFPNVHDMPHLTWEWRFVRDGKGYSIGPHTDAADKVMSFLFYLPTDQTNQDLGTGIYMPDDHVKTCPGGPHHKFDGFHEVYRAPYLPNSCLGFWKTSNSWHGVQKISKIVQRDVLLYNIYCLPSKEK